MKISIVRAIQSLTACVIVTAFSGLATVQAQLNTNNAAGGGLANTNLDPGNLFGSNFGNQAATGFGNAATGGTPFGLQAGSIDTAFGNNAGGNQNTGIGGVGNTGFGGAAGGVGGFGGAGGINGGLGGGVGGIGGGLGGFGGLGGIGGLGGFGGIGGFGGLGGFNNRFNNQNNNQNDDSTIRARLILGFEAPRVSQTTQARNISVRLRQMPLPERMRSIQVSMMGSRAILSGTAESEADVRMMSKLLMLEPGINEVISQVRVQ